MKNFESILSLPIYTKLTDQEVDYIIQAVKDVYESII
jgi:dTDP-4-amino-4,6-dideoxygalactose transaminase